MEKRFRGPIILSLLILAYSFSFLFIVPLEGDTIPIIPGGAYSDYILSIAIPIGIMILMYFVGHYIAKSLIPLHKALKLNRYDYFIIQPEKKLTGSKMIIRSIYPGLLAINIAMYIALYGIYSDLFYAGANEENLPQTIEYVAILVGIPIATLIITPIWILDSSGLMCSLNQEKYKSRVSPDIESVGRFYSTIFKGYVGISTVVTYILVLYTFANRGVTLDNYFLIFIDPFFFLLFFVFLSLLLEVGVNKINDRLMKRYEKMGISLIPQEIKIVPKS